MRLRLTLAANLSALIDAYPSKATSLTNRYMDVAKKLGTSLSQVQRLVQGSVGTSIDQLAVLAKIFHVTPCDLLDPALTVKRQQPQEIRKRDAL